MAVIPRAAILSYRCNHAIITTLRLAHLATAPNKKYSSKYSHSGKTISSIFSSASYNNSKTLNQKLNLKHLESKVLSHVPVRTAGHAKWQNIAHTKSANDDKFSKTCVRYGNLIGISIKENGNIADPKHNTKLAKVIADAQSENVSKGTIENAIKRAKNSDTVMVESLSEVRGPGNTFIIIESFGKSARITEDLIKGILRKAKAGILDKGMLNMFERRGVIITKASQDLTVDAAEEDAIEFGAEEITEADVPAHDGSKVLQFLCDPLDFTSVKSNLEAKSSEGGSVYSIVSANIEYIPTGGYVDLANQKEEDAFRKLISLLNENEMVTGVYHNCSLDTSS